VRLVPLTAIVALAIAGGLVLAVPAGSVEQCTGYTCSYTQGAPVALFPNIDLISFDTAQSSSNLSVQLAVEGTFVMNDPAYEYTVSFYNGANASTSTFAFFGNGTIGNFTTLAPGLPPAGPLYFALEDQRSVLTFSIALSLIAPASDLYVVASAGVSVGSGSNSTIASSDLGYNSTGGSCAGPLCNPATSPGGSSSPLSQRDWILLIAGVVIVAAVGVVLLLRQRVEKSPPPPPGSATPPAPPPAPPRGPGTGP
jgi:hypothetical protein